MPLHKIGRVGIVFYSEWEANRVYSYLDYVRTDGNCYMCVAEHLSDELNKPKDGEDSTFWRVVVDNSTTKLELLQNIDEKFEATKAELRDYIGEVMANLNKAVIVENLPDTGEIGTLYLVANGGSDDNLYDEYIYINKGSEANPNFVFEKLGTKEIDLSGYYKKEQIDELLNEIKEQNTGTGTAGAGELEIDRFKTISVSIDDLVLPAHSRVNQQPQIENFPDGYEIVAFKQISITSGSSATQDKLAWKEVIIQSFSTTGGGTKPNVSIYNMGDNEAIVKLEIVALCRKQEKASAVVNSTVENLEIQEKVTTLENKIGVLTNFDKLALPLVLKTPQVSYADLQEELDILTGGKYRVVENSLIDGMNMSGMAIGSVELIEIATNEKFRLMLSYARTWN